ncbi:MAG: ABC transporter permease [Actinomycetota bacterium]|nr:ABC transporter permease [Actinomycetota bacterium]
MNNLRAVYAIWLRDVIRYKRDKARVVSSLAQPALFLFVFGNGLARGLSINVATGGARTGYVAFIYPGIIGMTLLFTSMFTAVSIVWDREFGFLKEVMVAPISRASVAIGKALGGSTVALIQGGIVLLLSPFLGVKLSPLLIITVLPVMLLISFSLTSIGIVIAAKMESMEGFQVIMNFLIMPLFVLSGAMFPLTRLPVWLRSLTRADPLTYGVDALRGLILGPKLAEFSLALDLTVIALVGAIMISVAVYFFERQ